jgi:hypothetical protein
MRGGHSVSRAELLAAFAGASRGSHKELDDCFGDFLVRVTCRCGAVREPGQPPREFDPEQLTTTYQN